MTRFLYDTAVFVFAYGRAHRYREPCVRIIDLAGEGLLQGDASADLLQEFVNHRARITGDRGLAVQQARTVIPLCRLHDLKVGDIERGLEIFETAPRAGARDSVFAAVALNRGIDAILSPDRGFDQIKGLRRLDPADTEGVDSLLVDPPEGR